MTKPYPQKNLTLEKLSTLSTLQNETHIRECLYYLLANHWRVFRRSFHLEPKKVKSVTLAAITLPDWLRRNSEIGKVYVPQWLIDPKDPDNGEVIDGSWRSDTSNESWKSLFFTKANNPIKEAHFIREEFTEYFSNEGCMPWKWRYARVDIWIMKTFHQNKNENIMYNNRIIQTAIFLIIKCSY